jgi:hypothetical protein
MRLKELGEKAEGWTIGEWVLPSVESRWADKQILISRTEPLGRRLAEDRANRGTGPVERYWCPVIERQKGKLQMKR